MLFFNPQQTIGVDISDHVIRAVVVKTKRRKQVITAFSEVGISEGCIINGVIHNESTVCKIVEQLFSHQIDPRHMTAVIGLPESHGYIKGLFVKEGMVEQEIQKHLPFPYEEVTIDTIDHGPIEQEGIRGRVISFAAIKTNIAQSYYRILKATGLHIRAFEIESQAIARMFIGSAHPQPTIILGDIGRNHTTFVVVENGRIDFTHTSKLISGKMLTEEMQAAGHLSYEEAEKKKREEHLPSPLKKVIQRHTDALANELKRVVEFHQEHAVIKTKKEYLIHLTGGASQIPYLRQFLEEKILYAVQQVKVPPTLIVPPPLKEKILSYGTAIGLALRQYFPL